MRKTSRSADTEEGLSHHRAPLNNMLLTATLNLAPALRPRAGKKPAAKRGSLQVVAHGGVGGSGGTPYAGKDKPFGSDQAPWRKKLITSDPAPGDPVANAGRGGGGTPPPHAGVLRGVRALLRRLLLGRARALLRRFLLGRPRPLVRRFVLGRPRPLVRRFLLGCPRRSQLRRRRQPRRPLRKGHRQGWHHVRPRPVRPQPLRRRLGDRFANTRIVAKPSFARETSCETRFRRSRRGERGLTKKGSAMFEK